MNSTVLETISSGHRVLVYYQTQYDPTLPPNSPFGHYVTPLPLIGVISHLLLAAFHINFADVSVHLNDYVPEAPFFDQMWKDIAILQKTGIKIIGMVGGAAPGSYVPCLNQTLFPTYYPVLRNYIRRYKLDGVDLDVEEGVLLDDIIRLIKQLRRDFGPEFIITLAPVASALEQGGNLSGFDYIELEKKAGHLISWYNAQFYSGFGTFFPDDQYLEIVNYGRGLDPSRLVATTVTNPEDSYGFVDIDQVVQSVTDLASKQHFAFGGVAGWEYWNALPGGSNQPYLWAQIMAKAMKGIQANHARELQLRSRITGNKG